MKGRRLTILVLVLFIALGTSLLGLIRAIPQLVSVSPVAEALAVPAPAPLRLTFSRPMEPETVIERLTIEPPHPGEFTWEGTTLTFTPAIPWPQSQQVHVNLDPGAQAVLLGLPTLRGFSWFFTVESSRLAYLWPHDAPADIYLLDPISGDIQRLTETHTGVLDFSIRADGVEIYFSATNATGGSDLYRLDRVSQTTSRLLHCPNHLCRDVQISPDGAFLTYQRTAVLDSGEGGDTQIRLVDLSADFPSEGDVVASLSLPSGTLLWSPTGLLVYHDAGEEAYILYDPTGGEGTRFENATGTGGSWSPDGNSFIVPEILSELGEGVNPATQPSHLMRFEPRTGRVEDLTMAMIFEDTDPVFSPDGLQLAFARKYLDLPRWTPGRQLWVMESNGTNARALSDDPLFTHKDFAWHADGSQLAYTRFNQVTLTDPPEIWLVNTAGGTPLRLIIGGYDLQWLP